LAFYLKKKRQFNPTVAVFLTKKLHHDISFLPHLTKNKKKTRVLLK